MELDPRDWIEVYWLLFLVALILIFMAFITGCGSGDGDSYLYEQECEVCDFSGNQIICSTYTTNSVLGCA